MAYMLYGVDNHILVIGEDDIGMLTHKLDYQVFSAKITHFIQVLKFEADNTF